MAVLSAVCEGWMLPATGPHRSSALPGRASAIRSDDGGVGSAGGGALCFAGTFMVVTLTGSGWSGVATAGWGLAGATIGAMGADDGGVQDPPRLSLQPKVWWLQRGSSDQERDGRAWQWRGMRRPRQPMPQRQARCALATRGFAAHRVTKTERPIFLGPPKERPRLCRTLLLPGARENIRSFHDPRLVCTRRTSFPDKLCRRPLRSARPAKISI